jgi:hypothetical protein
MYDLEEMRVIRGTFFGACDLHISLKEAFVNFESMTTFALLTEIYLSNFSDHSFSKSVRKGVSLNDFRDEHLLNIKLGIHCSL